MSRKLDRLNAHPHLRHGRSLRVLPQRLARPLVACHEVDDVGGWPALSASVLNHLRKEWKSTSDDSPSPPPTSTLRRYWVKACEACAERGRDVVASGNSSKRYASASFPFVRRATMARSLEWIGTDRPRGSRFWRLNAKASPAQSRTRSEHTASMRAPVSATTIIRSGRTEEASPESRRFISVSVNARLPAWSSSTELYTLRRSGACVLFQGLSSRWRRRFSYLQCSGGGREGDLEAHCFKTDALRSSSTVLPVHEVSAIDDTTFSCRWIVVRILEHWAC